jgi:hypothetical protein
MEVVKSKTYKFYRKIRFIPFGWIFDIELFEWMGKEFGIMIDTPSQSGGSHFSIRIHFWPIYFSLWNGK